MNIIAILALASLAGLADAKLPPPSAEAKALSAEAAAKSAWTDKVGLYQLCRSMDRTAEAYRNSLKTEGRLSSPPALTAPCVDPGPYGAQSEVTPASSKPLEASAAHSPAGMAVSPPSTNKTDAELSKARKP
jgi:hypothetical protein